MAATKSADAPAVRSRLKIILMGYVVTLTFAAVFAAVFAVMRPWDPDEAPDVAIGAAVVMSLPLAVAFVGDRIHSFRGFGIAFETKSATVATNEIADFENAGLAKVTEIEFSEITTSSSTTTADGMPAQIAGVIGSPRCEVIRVDLHDGSYWLPTRLYLLTALLAEYTDVKRVVFTQRITSSGCQTYAGMAEPAAVVRGIDRVLPPLAAAYRAAHTQAVRQYSIDDGMTADRASLAAATASAWPEAVTAHGIRDGACRVNRAWLQETLVEAWRWSAIDSDGDQDSPLIQYLIATSPEDYTALLSGDQLQRVIGKHRLTEAIASGYLRQRLKA